MAFRLGLGRCGLVCGTTGRNAKLRREHAFSAADGDIVYISFATAEARERAPKVMNSDAWRKLSANRDNRIYAVNNEIWQTGQGIVAARGIMADLRLVNAPIN